MVLFAVFELPDMSLWTSSPFLFVLYYSFGLVGFAITQSLSSLALVTASFQSRIRLWSRDSSDRDVNTERREQCLVDWKTSQSSTKEESSISLVEEGRAFR